MTRAERLEAVYYGEMAKVIADPEEILHRVAKTDARFKSVVTSLELAKAYPGIQAIGRQGFKEPVLPIMVADYGAVSPAAATETVLWTPNATTQTHSRVPANTVYAGQYLQLNVGGVVTTPASAGTITFVPRWGVSTAGVQLGNSTATAGSNSFTGAAWMIQFHMWFRSHGSAIVAKAFGTFESHAVARDIIMGGTTATVDTTADSGIVFGVSDSVSSVSYTPTQMIMFIAG